jgi:hypothetical protein
LVTRPRRQVLRRGLDAPVGQAGQGLGIALASHHRLDHAPPAQADDVADRRIELDVGILERLLEAQRMAGPFAHQLLARPHKTAQLLRLAIRHEARPDQPVRLQIGQPLRVADIALAARHVLDVRRIGQHQLELAVAQDMPYRLPIDAGRLHHHVPHAMAIQPVRKRQQIPRHRLEGSNFAFDLDALHHTHAGHHRVLVNIQACTTLM